MRRPLRSLLPRTAALLLPLALPLVLTAPAEAGRYDYVDRHHRNDIELPRMGDWSQTPSQAGVQTEVAMFKVDK